MSSFCMFSLLALSLSSNILQFELENMQTSENQHDSVKRLGMPYFVHFFPTDKLPIRCIFPYKQLRVIMVTEWGNKCT